jgi:hypothetical protein
MPASFRCSPPQKDFTIFDCDSDFHCSLRFFFITPTRSTFRLLVPTVIGECVLAFSKKRRTLVGINKFKDGPTPFGVVAKGLLALGTPPPLSFPSGGRAVAMRWGVAIGAVHRAVHRFELSHTIPHFSGEGAVDEH